MLYKLDKKGLNQAVRGSIKKLSRKVKIYFFVNNVIKQWLTELVTSLF